MERAIHTGAKNVDLFKRLIFSFDPGQNPDIWETARQSAVAEKVDALF